MARRKRLLLVLAGGVGLAAGVLPAVVPVAAGAAPTITPVWSQTIDDPGGMIIKSSPMVATLADGQPSVVVGDESGKLYAFHLANGSPTPGWSGVAAGAAVDSTPSVSGSGANAIVYVGVGNAAAPAAGGYAAFNANGSTRWFHNALASPTGGTSAVSASLAVGNLQGGTDVVGGDLGQEEYAFNGPSGGVLAGFPWFQADSNFSTAALAPIGGSATDFIIEGGASTAGNAFNHVYSNGGHLTILSPTGNAGQPEPNGGFRCMFNLDEEVDSSPAVGGFGPGGAQSIAFGTGSFWHGSTDDHVLAVNPSCGEMWSAGLDGLTSSSPALVDALGNGSLQVAEGTDTGTGGSVYLLNGANGSVIWRTTALGRVIGSVVSADLTGAGYQDLIVPTSLGVEILDGRSGAVVGTLATAASNGLGFQNSPLVTEDPNGSLGITIAGYNTGTHTSTVIHYEVSGARGSAANEAGAWPMFHHDPQLSGNAGGSSAPPPPPGPVVVPCSPPAGGPRGYIETAADGGIFTFGNLPFCGSTGNIVLNKPVVGGVETRDGGGYWLVASDGGIFSFGNAGFFGSTGNIHLNQPTVGMASTPDGRGYWLVASDGGIFAFGDAGFFGSTGNIHLNQPVVGMASTPDGRGYWLVASDGGIFSFGDARFFGSTGAIHLNKPVVGMAASPSGNGYWLVASDGGIFTFGQATFFGSTGSLVLNRPVVGMQATPEGSGYRLVASDGGVFSFGDAAFFGSMGGKPLNQPIVSISGF